MESLLNLAHLVDHDRQTSLHPSLFSLIRMPSQWTRQELAIVVYFASRGAGHEACRKILLRKVAGKRPEERTLLAIRGRLDQIRHVEGLWNDTTGW